MLGTADYARKCGFTRCPSLGLSGGIDSALTAVIAVEALGKRMCAAYLFPSQFSSQGSLDDARILAANLGIRYDVIPYSTLYRLRSGERATRECIRRTEGKTSPKRTFRRACAA